MEKGQDGGGFSGIAVGAGRSCPLKRFIRLNQSFLRLDFHDQLSQIFHSQIPLLKAISKKEIRHKTQQNNSTSISQFD